MTNDHTPPAESPQSHQAEGAGAVSPGWRQRDPTAPDRRRRWRERIRRQLWKGIARLAQPAPGGSCPWGARDPVACGSCQAGQPCQFERRLWTATKEEGLAAGWSESASSLRASIELRLARLTVEGGDAERLTELEIGLLRVQLAAEGRQRRDEIARERLAIARAALAPPESYQTRLSRILDIPASQPAKPAGGAAGALPVGAAPEPLDALPAVPVAEPEPPVAEPEPTVPTAAEPAPPAVRWPAGLPSLDDEPTYF